MKPAHLIALLLLVPAVAIGIFFTVVQDVEAGAQNGALELTGATAVPELEAEFQAIQAANKRVTRVELKSESARTGSWRVIEVRDDCVVLDGAKGQWLVPLSNVSAVTAGPATP